MCRARATLFLDAGHILGSASVFLEFEENGQRHRVLFSGDLGYSGRVILRDLAKRHRGNEMLLFIFDLTRQHSAKVVQLFGHRLNNVVHTDNSDKLRVPGDDYTSDAVFFHRRSDLEEIGIGTDSCWFSGAQIRHADRLGIESAIEPKRTLRRVASQHLLERTPSIPKRDPRRHPPNMKPK